MVTITPARRSTGETVGMYTVLLVVHVLSAIILLGPAYLNPFLPKIVDTTSVPVLKVMKQIEQNVMIFLVVQLLTGVGLIFTPHNQYIRDDFGKYWWLQTSMLLFVIAGGIASGYNLPRIRKALEASEAGDTTTAASLLAPLEKVTGPILGLLGAIIIVLMVWQPHA